MNTRHSILVLLCGMLLNSPLDAEDWPQFRGPNRDAAWNESGTLEVFPSEGLKVRWRATIGPGFSSPVVAQGRVYITDCRLEKPTAEERVLCFDEKSGQPLWNHHYFVAYPEWAFDPNGGGPRATPIVQDGRIYTLGAMGHLFCLDAVSGKVVWEKDLARDYGVKEFTGITASPLIDNDLLILYMCGKPDACVVAFQKTTGQEVWRALDDAFSYSSPLVITSGGARQLIVWTQDGVTSLHPGTGKIHWREEFRTPGDQIVSSPVFLNHRLLIGGLMFKLDDKEPRASILWPELKPVAKRILCDTCTALLQGDYIYSGKSSGALVCLEADTGREIWSTSAVTAAGHGASMHLTPNGDSVLIFTDEGQLIRARLSPKGYEELTRSPLIKPTYSFGGRLVVWPPPAYANRQVFVRNDLEMICASLASDP